MTMNPLEQQRYVKGGKSAFEWQELAEPTSWAEIDAIRSSDARFGQPLQPYQSVTDVLDGSKEPPPFQIAAFHTALGTSGLLLNKCAVALPFDKAVSYPTVKVWACEDGELAGAVDEDYPLGGVSPDVNPEDFILVGKPLVIREDNSRN